MIQDVFECQCCPSYEGMHCEERDACFESPCLNKGICVDLSQGHEGVSFQCLCPYGKWTFNADRMISPFIGSVFLFIELIFYVL